MKLSVIIPIYNALDDVKLLVKSLQENFNFSLGEICLVNDCSNKETSEYLKTLTNFQLIENDTNLGFVKTCNKGMKTASNDIIVLLNSDTKIPKNFAERIIDCFESNDKIGVASPISSASLHYYIPLKNDGDLEKINQKLQTKHKSTYPTIPSAEGFCFCIRRQVIEKQGYLDEVYGKGYHEEIDFSYRAITNGWINVLIDNLYVYHKRHASFSDKVRLNQITNNNLIFMERWEHFAENYCKENNIKNPMNKILLDLYPVKTMLKKICSIKIKENHIQICILGLQLSIRRKRNVS